jgi:hypothetical protein
VCVCVCVVAESIGTSETSLQELRAEENYRISRLKKSIFPRRKSPEITLRLDTEGQKVTKSTKKTFLTIGCAL